MACNKQMGIFQFYIFMFTILEHFYHGFQPFLICWCGMGVESHQQYKVNIETVDLQIIPWLQTTTRECLLQTSALDIHLQPHLILKIFQNSTLRCRNRLEQKQLVIIIKKKLKYSADLQIRHFQQSILSDAKMENASTNYFKYDASKVLKLSNVQLVHSSK